MKNDHTPEIRFSTFNDVWTQRALNSVADRLKSYSLSRDVETKEFTGYKYIHYGDIHTKVAEIVDKNTNLPNIKPGNYELLEKGDLVLADASEDYQGIATPAVITENVSYKLVAGLHTIALRPKNIDSLFLYYLLNSPTFKRYGYKTGTGMKVFGISVTNLMKFESMFPLLEEQIKIGDFLRKIDKTIVLHQQGLTTLKQTKQGFLQKMFPKEGASVPEIRFPGFTDEWDKRKLGELASITTGKLDANAMKEGGKYDFYTSGIKKYKIDIPAFNGPAITIAGNGATVGYMHLADNKFNAYQRTYVLSDFKADRGFLFREIGKKLPKKINQQARKGNIPYIVMDMLTDLHVSLPSSLEQQTISNFFKQLDKVIVLHQHELDVLKQTKKAFLQKMFV